MELTPQKVPPAGEKQTANPNQASKVPLKKETETPLPKRQPPAQVQESRSRRPGRKNDVKDAPPRKAKKNRHGLRAFLISAFISAVSVVFSLNADALPDFLHPALVGFLQWLNAMRESIVWVLLPLLQNRVSDPLFVASCGAMFLSAIPPFLIALLVCRLLGSLVDRIQQKYRAWRKTVEDRKNNKAEKIQTENELQRLKVFNTDEMNSGLTEEARQKADARFEEKKKSVVPLAFRESYLRVQNMTPGAEYDVIRRWDKDNSYSLEIPVGDRTQYVHFHMNGDEVLVRYPGEDELEHEGVLKRNSPLLIAQPDGLGGICQYAVTWFGGTGA